MLNYKRLSKVISHALRHEPEKYGIKLDSNGWAPIQTLIEGIKRQAPVFSAIEIEDITSAIQSSDKVRHEIKSGQIRATYGHSTKKKINKTIEMTGVPDHLFHGTSPDAWAIIKEEGLNPQSRQYVHMSNNAQVARKVGARKSKNPVVLQIDTILARKNSVQFSREKNGVWLSNAIPSFCIKEIAKN
ncbi:RNA 2'-phosphotransferase [Sneathiella glossodoripedis]|uniref:RNA 2'-phosphotransferase n=1 Tax=Sneathiella glossodoripedis TaxID=418853 RepID=UPI0004726C3D|nr:RNA 2'-phosphotransferase [Sneathiella glossodoripedis]